MNPDRYLLLTLPASQTGIIHPDELRDAKAQMTPEAYEIEYECSFDASIPGAYFARDIGRIYDQGQIGENPRDPDFPVYVAGDLGFTDSCSWWVWQRAAGGFRIVDYYEADGREIQHYTDWIHGLGNVAEVYLPHDARAKSLQTGRSMVEVFLQNGTQTFKDKPNHDAHSHAADAFRYMALASGKVPSGMVLTNSHHSGDNVANYSFSLNDLWDTAPKPSRRIG